MSFIEFENVYRRYHTGEIVIPAVSGVNFSIEKGEFCLIVGTSGAGKSTLLRCIAQLEKPTSGAIYIEGKNITELSGKENIELRKRVGVIFQGYHLLMQRTVRDNIAFPLELSGMKKEERYIPYSRKRFKDIARSQRFHMRLSTDFIPT